MRGFASRTPGNISEFRCAHRSKRHGVWGDFNITEHTTGMMYMINRRLMSVMLDDNPAMAVDHGSWRCNWKAGAISKFISQLWIKNLP